MQMQFTTHIHDLGSKPVSPVGGKTFDDGGNDHEDLDGPKHGLATESVKWPVSDKEDDDQRPGVDTCGALASIFAGAGYGT